MERKFDFFKEFQKFPVRIEKFYNQVISCIRIDGGDEFVNIKFKTYIIDNGITHLWSCPYSSKQNDLIERRHLIVL